MAKKNKMSLFGGVRGGKSDYPKSCNKLKKRHPQGIKRSIDMHPQNLERMNAEQEEETK